MTLDAFASSSKNFASGGYEVIVDGIIGPWYLTPWLDIANANTDVRLMFLRPNLETVLQRAQVRVQKENLSNRETLTQMWSFFFELGSYEANVIDTSTQSPNETAKIIGAQLDEGRFQLAAQDI